MQNQAHTILVVDDETITRALLAKLLGGSYKVITARSGQEAIEALRREPVSMLLTDQNMPGMSGTELLRQARDINPNMVCVLMTAVNDTETVIDAVVNSGAIRVMTKPWDPDKLLEEIRLLISRYEANLVGKHALDRLRQASDSLDRITGKR